MTVNGDVEPDYEPWDPEEQYAEDAAYQRFMELAELAGRNGLEVEEGRGWVCFLEDLATMTADELSGDLAECTEYMDGAGWIEDTHGDAVFFRY